MAQCERVFRQERGATNAPQRVNDCQFALGFESANLTSRLQTFETEMLAEDANFAGLGRLNRALIGKAEAIGSGHRTVLDMDSTEIPVYGEHEQSAYNGYGRKGPLREWCLRKLDDRTVVSSFGTRGRQKRVVRTIPARENAPKGLGWRQTGVYSQAPERQKANSGWNRWPPNDGMQPTALGL